MYSKNFLVLILCVVFFVTGCRNNPFNNSNTTSPNASVYISTLETELTPYGIFYVEFEEGGKQNDFTYDIRSENGAEFIMISSTTDESVFTPQRYDILINNREFNVGNSKAVFSEDFKRLDVAGLIFNRKE